MAQFFRRLVVPAFIFAACANDMIEVPTAGLPGADPGVESKPSQVAGLGGTSAAPNSTPESSTNGDGGVGSDGSPEAPVALALENCDLAAPFEAPVAALTGSMDADGLTFSADGLTAYISGAGPGNRDIYVATRSSPNGIFGTPELVTAVNTPGIERAPSLSPDGKLYFTKQPSFLDIGRAVGIAPAFTGAEPVTALSSPWQDEDPFWWGSNTLYFVSEIESQGAHRDIWMAIWDGASFSQPTKVQGQDLHSSAEEFRPVVSPDGLTLYFSSRRTGIGNDTSGDIFMARRPSTGAAFLPAVNLWGMNTTGIDYPVTMSADGCTLYFASNEETGLGASTNFRLYQATRGTSTPAQVTLRLNILGTGSVVHGPFNCGPGNSGTCSASAPPDTTMLVWATAQGQWTGSCTAYGGHPSTDGILTFAQNAVCTIKFPNANLVGDGGLCSLSMDCDQGVECVNNKCGCPSSVDPNSNGQPSASVSFETQVDGEPASYLLTTWIDKITEISETTIVFRRGANALLTEQITTSPDGEQAFLTFDYGVGFVGIQHAEATMTGTTVELVVDGRAAVPFEVGSDDPIVFADGNPPPDATVTASTAHALEVLERGVHTRGTSCVGSSPTLPLPFAGVVAAPPPPLFGGTSGHTFDGFNSADCDGCRQEVAIDFAACHAYYNGFCAIAAAANPLIGLGCALEASAGCASAMQADLRICKRPGNVCCHVGCGNGCCDKNDSCLDTQQELCCSPPLESCPGDSPHCFDPDTEKCLTSGHVCTLENVCGDDGCCRPNDCINGTCCSSGHGCGDICCPGGVRTGCVNGACCSNVCGDECCTEEQFCNADLNCETPVCTDPSPQLCLGRVEAHCCTDDETCCAEGCCPAVIDVFGEPVGPVNCCGDVCCVGGCITVPDPSNPPTGTKLACGGFIQQPPRVP